ncbi:hypothetical protein GDO86_011138 [Hymenochirus boettgeri]|uniref:Metallophosphoesterase 1 n=1 Tax=Hymenochirus boettgeri TaxID=247094 RepID=A0A8T2JD08_9PIPI|nr:hypothetical protein GDO86_011138 [Hymenochirus boettgeri]
MAWTGHMGRKCFFLFPFLGFIFVVFFFCEFLIYYMVIIKCNWPHVKNTREQDSMSNLKAIFLADTHLLGEIRGHWFDKLRREWQMERSYQSALWLLQPDIIFILGDVFDEGKWSRPEAWSKDVARFQKMFRHPPQTELIVIVGNHDIGFHYDMTLYKLNRFEKIFNFTSGRLVSRKGINFVLVNSVALEGDHCNICRDSEDQLRKVSTQLNCSRMNRSHPNFQKKCQHFGEISASAPILLQHYPLYRVSDAECTGEDSATPDEKKMIFKERYDVLSKEASEKLLQLLQPRLILSGHTHSACKVVHRGNIPEISVPSFSWRNRNNPSFIMGSITADRFSLEKCFLPTEYTVVYIYTTACVLVTGYLFIYLGHFAYLKMYLTRKEKPV